MARFHSLLVVVLVCAVLVHTGECLMCYECSSSLNGPCADVSNKPEFQKQCLSGQVCYYKFALDHPSGQLTRGCGSKSVCNTTPGPMLCATCESDLCNG